MRSTALQRKARKVNKARGQAGATVIQLWIENTQQRNEDPYYGEGKEGKREAAIDILTNLRHWADLKHENFHKLLDRSYDHYLEEKSAERDL